MSENTFMPKISVIIPVYKAEKYLARCIQSVLNQTFTDFELILVDDGSPDNSPFLCDEWKKRDSRIKVIHKLNGGASSARNAGLELSKGKWITFLDSDDWIDKAMLKTFYDYVNKYKAQMVISEIEFVKKYKETKCKETKNEIKILSSIEALNRFFRLNGGPDPHSVCGTLIRSDILDAYRFIEGKMNEDIEACYYLSRTCKKIVYIKKSFYKYFQNKKGVTNSIFNRKKLDLIYVWDLVKHQVEQYTPEYIYACEMNCKRARFTLLTQMYINGYDHNDLYIKKYKEILEQEVHKYFFELIKWKMPISRKIILIFEYILTFRR